MATELKFKRKPKIELDQIPIEDGSILFDTTNKEILVDDGNKREKYGSGVPNELKQQVEQNKNDILSKVTIPETGEVGQVLKVKSVDESGKPNGFETGDSLKNNIEYTDLDSQLQKSFIYVNNNAIINKSNITDLKYGSIVVENNSIKIKGTSESDRLQFTFNVPDLILNMNDKVYVNYKIKNKSLGITRIFAKEFQTKEFEVLNPIQEVYEERSIIEITKSVNNSIFFVVFFQNETTALNQEFEVKDFVILNLTKTFGKGNEPSLEETQKWGYFENYINGYNAKKVNSYLPKIDELYQNRYIVKNLCNELTRKGERKSLSNTVYVQNSSTETFEVGDVIYSSCNLKCDGENPLFIDYKIESTGEKFKIDVIKDTWYKVSCCHYIIADTSPVINFRFNFELGDTKPKTLSFDNFVILNLTKIFGKGNEPSSEIIDNILSQYFDDSFGDYKNIATAKSIMIQPRNILGIKGNSVKTNEIGSVDLYSVPNSSWSKWKEKNQDGIASYAFGQEKQSNTPVYNNIHGTIETDGMYSVIPRFGRFTEGASNQPYKYGGHVFEGWNTLRTHRFTAVMGHYDKDEVALIVYHPGHGDYGYVRLGNDMEKKGYVFGGNYAKFYGNVEFVNFKDGIVLTSPNGSKYTVRVKDNGELYTIPLSDSPIFPDDRIEH